MNENENWLLSSQITLKQALIWAVTIVAIFIGLHYLLTALSADDTKKTSSADVATGSVGTGITQEEFSKLYAEKWRKLWAETKKWDEYKQAIADRQEADAKIEAAKQEALWNQ